jgi:hypothetical protein
MAIGSALSATQLPVSSRLRPTATRPTRLPSGGAWLLFPLQVLVLVLMPVFVPPLLLLLLLTWAVLR